MRIVINTKQFGGCHLAIASLVALVALQACEPSRLLDAPDPDLVDPANVENASGAEAMRVGALARWRDATGGDNANGDENTWLLGGLLADEWATASTFVENDELDTRIIRTDNASVRQGFRDLHRVRTAAAQAIPLLRAYRATETTKVAELFLAKAQAEMQLASDFCGGLPLSNFAGGEEIEWSEALTTDSVFKVAVASYDSGLAIATGATGEPLRINRALRIGKARSLVALRRFAEAAALVANIPTDYAYEHTFSASTGDNALWGQPADSRRYNVGNNLEGNARDIPVANNLNFFSANDPRVPASYEITRSGTRVDTTRSQDGNTLSRTTTIWAQETPVAVFNGTDARLIEAEAAYQRQDYVEMMRILNELRANPPANGDVQPDPLPALTDPGTDQARVDLLFREKAFWTFGRGQRLGDLRRLLRDPYRRTPETTFPVGTHYRGGTYGTAIAMPIPQEEENNPRYQRAACTQ